MRKLITGSLGALLLTGVAIAQPPAGVPARPMVDKTKIVCDGEVKADGEVYLVFTAEGGDPQDIRITLRDGMDDDEVCRDIEKELAVVLGSAPYEVDRDDDQKVKVEGKGGARFSLNLGSLTATGITIQLK